MRSIKYLLLLLLLLVLVLLLSQVVFFIHGFTGSTTDGWTKALVAELLIRVYTDR